MSRSLNWLKMVLLLTLLGAIGGLLLSYAFPANYTSQSLVLWPARENVDTAPWEIKNGLPPGLATLQREVLTQSSLQAMLERTDGMADSTESPDDKMNRIRRNMTIELASFDQNGVPSVSKKALVWPIGFYVKYTDSTPRRAQQICNELTTMMLETVGNSYRKMSEDSIKFLISQISENEKN